MVVVTMDDIFLRDIDSDMDIFRRSSYGRSLGADLLASTEEYLRSLDSSSYNACMSAIDRSVAAYAMV